MSTLRVLVAGGGITGLAAALRLSETSGVHVEVWEASERLGGAIKSSPFAGLPAVDEGADAYLTRVPHATALARSVGLTGDALTTPATATPLVWHTRMHDLPNDTLLGVPTSLAPFARSSLLSRRGRLRAATEPLRPRVEHGDSLGALVRARFGDEVHDRVVDALVGSIYATDTDRCSLAAVPQLAELAASHRSLLLGARARRAASAPVGPIFETPRRGMGALVNAAATVLTLRGVLIRTGRALSALARDDDRWRADDEVFDAVVLAMPAAASAAVLADVAPEPADGLAGFEASDVVIVRLALGSDHASIGSVGHNGYLVTRPLIRRVTAVSFASQKWAHWQPPEGGEILRVSLGRDGVPVRDLDDDAITSAVTTELGDHLGVTIAPAEQSITRWLGAFPQYRPGHVDRVAAVERRLPAGIAVAGAAYRGIGIPACIADGQRAAATVAEHLDISGSAHNPPRHADGLLP